MSDFQDLEIRCSDCGVSFPFRATEQAFFAERSLTPPKRCKACRDARKTDGGGGRDAGGPSRGGPPSRDARGPGGGRFGARSGPPSRDAGGPGGDRRGPPRAAAFGDRDRGGPPRDRGPAPSFTARGPRTREDGSPSRDHSAPFAPREGGPRAGAARDFAPRGAGPRDAAAPDRGARGDTRSSFDPRDSRAGRVSPGPRVVDASRDAQPRAPKWGRPQHAFADGAGGASSDNSGSGADESNARAPRVAKEKKEKRPRSEGKAKFPVVCQTCGTSTEVPFAPIEGRPIFCQPCYRARRGTPNGGDTSTASDSGSGSIDAGDVGIVE